MKDIDIEVGNSLISLIDGKFISIYTEEEYTYGCSMTIPEWEAIKINVDNLIKSSKEGCMNDTEYLVSDIDMNEPVIDSVPNMDGDAIIKMMDNMSVAELKMLKATCSVLINFKLNESMSNQ